MTRFDDPGAASAHNAEMKNRDSMPSTPGRSLSRGVSGQAILPTAQT
jgi:hypothetical protein